MNNYTALKKEMLTAKVFESRNAMGKAAADFVAGQITSLLTHKEEIRIIFAAAPSQNEFLKHLLQAKIDWKRIVALHMDEYIGIDPQSPQSFRSYLHTHIFGKAPFKEIHYMNSAAADPQQEAERYAAILRDAPVDITCMGIGENGHLAFNDPPVADFDDTELVKIVELDEACRQQQVNDGCFPAFSDVPTHAITLTIPALLASQALSIVVPGKSKAEAVKKTLNDEITTACPATVLRKHTSTLFLDQDSASLIQ